MKQSVTGQVERSGQLSRGSSSEQVTKGTVWGYSITWCWWCSDEDVIISLGGEMSTSNTWFHCSSTSRGTWLTFLYACWSMAIFREELWMKIRLSSLRAKEKSQNTDHVLKRVGQSGGWGTVLFPFALTSLSRQTCSRLSSMQAAFLVVYCTLCCLAYR